MLSEVEEVEVEEEVELLVGGGIGEAVEVVLSLWVWWLFEVIVLADGEL